MNVGWKGRLKLKWYELSKEKNTGNKTKEIVSNRCSLVVIQGIDTDMNQIIPGVRADSTGRCSNQLHVDYQK